MVYTDFLTREHGYVVLASSGAFLLNMYLSVKVMQARKKFNVAYPAMYSDKEETFNCVQRAHQNTLEGIPFYLSLLWTGGLRHPLVSFQSFFKHLALVSDPWKYFTRSIKEVIKFIN